MFPRFVNFKEGAKLTYDLLRFLFRCYFDSVHVVHVVHTLSKKICMAITRLRNPTRFQKGHTHHGLHDGVVSEIDSLMLLVMQFYDVYKVSFITEVSPISLHVFIGQARFQDPR